jgi:hypothetical protein
VQQSIAFVGESPHSTFEPTDRFPCRTREHGESRVLAFYLAPKQVCQNSSLDPSQSSEQQVDEFDAHKRRDHTTDAIDEQVSS